MINIEEQQFVDNTANRFGPTTGGGGGNVNFGPPGGGNNRFGPISGGGNNNRFGPTTPQVDPFACVLKNADNKLSADKKTVVKTDSGGDIWTFYLDKKFTYKFKSSGKVVNGTWECDGTDNYKIKTEDGDSFDSKTGKWGGVPNSGSGSGSNSGGSSSAPVFTNTSLTIDDLKAGKTVSKGMKGDVVGEIQKLLIAAGYKNISKSGNIDKIFGSRTKKSVQDFQTANQLKVDGVVGVQTINALLNAKPDSSQSNEDPNKKPFDPNAEEDNTIPSTDGSLIKEKEKILKESLKKMLRNSLLKYS